MQHYQFHIGDYRSATMHLSDDEDLAYRRLIDHYYDTERPIDLDTGKVARKIRCALAIVDQVLAEFFTRTEEGFKNFRCEEVIAKFYEKSEVGRKYAQARWDRVRSEKASTTQSEPNGYPMATHTEPNANPMLPVTRNPLPVRKPEEIPPNGKKTARGSRLPAEWKLPKPWGEWAIGERPTWSPEEVRQCSLRFADFWHAKAGKDATKLDWLATWRNWVRNDRGGSSDRKPASGSDWTPPLMPAGPPQ